MKIIKGLLFFLMIGLWSCQIGTATDDKSVDEGPITEVVDNAYVWGNALDGLKIGIIMANDSLEVSIKNDSDSIIKVCSHINTLDLDWYSIHLTDQSGNIRIMHIGEALRTGSEMHTQTLNPQESFSHTIDLRYWAEQPINNKQTLLPGTYKVYATYRANDCFYPSKDYWNGAITSGTIEYKVE